MQYIVRYELRFLASSVSTCNNKQSDYERGSSCTACNNESCFFLFLLFLFLVLVICSRDQRFLEQFSSDRRNKFRSSSYRSYQRSKHINEANGSRYIVLILKPRVAVNKGGFARARNCDNSYYDCYAPALGLKMKKSTKIFFHALSKS